MLIISQWKLLFWSEKIFCLQKYSMPANNGCYCRHSTSHETCALHTHFRSQPSLAPLSCPSKTSYTGVKKKKPITTFDFLPVQVFSQKPSSYPNQQRRKTFGAETKRMRLTPSFSSGWFTGFLQQHAQLYTPVPTRRFPEMPDLLGLRGSKARHVQGTPQPPQPPPSHSGAHRGQQPRLPLCPREAEAIRCQPQNQLPEPRYAVFQHTTVTGAGGSRVRISLQFLSTFHLVIPVVNPRLN